jgi:hypothetical protein
MTSLSACVMVGVIGARGIAATGSIGRAAKAQTAKPISIKRFIEAPRGTLALSGHEEKCLATYMVPLMTALDELEGGPL